MSPSKPQSEPTSRRDIERPGTLLGLPLTYANLSLSEEELGRMDLVEQETLLDRLHYRQKYQMLQRSDHAVELLDRMTPTDLLYMFDAVGRTDTMDMVLKLSPERLIRMFDLDCWQGDEYDQDKQLDWFGYMLQENIDDGPEKIATLEYEYLLLFFSRHIRVHRPEWNDYPEAATADKLVTVDDYYHIEFLDPDSPRTERLVVLIQNMYRAAFETYGRIMEGLIWESPSGLQEFNFRSRNDRLQDWGYPEYLDSLGILAAEDPEKIRQNLLRTLPPEPKMDVVSLAHPPTVLHKLFESPSFFLDALAKIPDERRLALATELAYAGNRALVAFKALSNLDQAERTLAHTHGFLAIGLEYLSEGDVERAADLLTKTPLWHIVRLGYNLQRKLRQTVMDFFTSAYPEGRPKALPLLADPLPDVLHGLIQMPPRYYEGLSGDSMNFREFRALSELRQAEGLLQRTVFLYDLHFRVLGLSRQDVENSPAMPLGRDSQPVPVFVKLFFTLFCRNLSGLSADFEPFSKKEFLTLLPMILTKMEQGYRVADGLADSLRLWLRPFLRGESETYGKQVSVFAEECVDLLNGLAGSLESLDYRHSVVLGHLIYLG